MTLVPKDVFSSRYTTAVISDSSNTIHLVPIKYTLGDYFVTEINRSLHVFKIDGRQLKHYRGNLKKLTRPYSLLFYDTTHYQPINTDSDELKLVLEKNSLPKVDSTLAHIFKVLGNREKKDFEPHNLNKLIEYLNELHGDTKKQKSVLKSGYNYDESIVNVVNYLKRLDIDEIVTPLKRVSEYIQDDLTGTDPAFLGTVIDSYQRTDLEHRKITNTPSLGNRNFTKLIIFGLIVGVFVFLGYVLYEGGFLDSSASTSFSNPFGSLMPDFNTTLDPSNDEDIMKKYTTPESLTNAIDKGEINFEDLSPKTQAMIEGSG